MMSFKNIRQARMYVWEMSEEATAEIGDQEVWEYEPTREVFVGTTANQIVEDDADAADNYRLIGLVREVLY
jgi:hypothetical protein